MSTSYGASTGRPVLLIGFQQQGNLGLGYLASTLRQRGHQVVVLDFERSPGDILTAVRELDPVVVGFSLIFQFFVGRFQSLAAHLRANGVACHFTMGGHYPSLSYAQALATVPELDSVVRFEGEETLAALVDALAAGRDWREEAGIAYRRDGEVVAMPARPLVADLDQLPYPERDFEPETVLGRRAMPLVASRGCARTCSFCSIQTFYRVAPGKIVRTRRPAAVVKEMLSLHEERGITIFLFQDDDFPLFGKVWQRWANELVDEMYRAGLPGKIIWKINCRADAVEPALFARMRDAGLYLVYMGLESGTEEGLETLNKGITVEQNLRAVRVLKELAIRFEFGFMLLDPSSSFESVRDNLEFLRAIVGDGSTAATFCKMLPYDGTPIKDELERSGRLKGDVCAPDYDFLDPRLQDFYRVLSEMVDVSGWIHGYRALSPQLSWAWNELAVMEHLFPHLPGIDGYRARIRAVTRASNELLFTVVEDLASEFAKGRAPTGDPEALRVHCAEFLESLLRERNAFVLQNKEMLLAALGDVKPDRQPEPVAGWGYPIAVLA